MRKLTMVIALIASTLSANVSAELKNYESVEGWDVYSDDKDCTLAGDFGTSGSLSLDYNNSTNIVTVRFTVPQTQSLRDGEHRSIDIVFLTEGGKTVDTGWGTKNFLVAVADGQALLGRELSAQFLDDIAKYQYLGFMYNGKVVTSYKLGGSAKAVTSLKTCARWVASKSPSDPFAR